MAATDRSARRPSARTFRRSARAICARKAREIRTLDRPTDIASYKRFLGNGADATQRAVNDLARLHAPDALRDTLRGALAAEVAKLKQLRAIAASADPLRTLQARGTALEVATSQAGQMWQRAGIGSCGIRSA